MKMSNSFPSKFLRADDLQGKEVRVTLDRCVYEDVSGDGENKPVLYFQGKKKGLVLNKTNATKLSAAYGDESDDWDGKEAVLYPDSTQFQGRMVDCIRIRVPAQQADPSEAPPF